MFETTVLAQVNPDADEASLHRRIEELERAKSAAAAGQARCAALLDAKRRADEAATGVPSAKRGRGVASEVALARHDRGADLDVRAAVWPPGRAEQGDASGDGTKPVEVS